MKTIKKIFSAQGPAFITQENRQALNPFVLFDAGLVQTNEKEWGFDWHPHSGVATLTFPYLGDLEHADSGGNEGTIHEAGFQWMQAGGGIWHKEIYHPKNNKVGVQQLWVRLAPEEEGAPPAYFDVQPDKVPVKGNTRVFIGTFDGLESPHKVPADITYLDVKLKKGESWEFQPPQSQTRGFIFPRVGSLSIGSQAVAALHLAQLEESQEKLQVMANEETEFIVALAAPSPHGLVHEYGQIHTNQDELDAAKRRIQDLKVELTQKGKIR